MSIQHIQGQTLTADGWLTFINNAMASDIYHEIISTTSDSSLAAAVILLDSYFDDCTSDEKVALLRNEDLFRENAQLFTGLMDGIRYSQEHYDKSLRAHYIGIIKSLLADQKKDGEIVYKNRYEFIKTVVRFTSDIEFVINCYRKYKSIYLEIK